MHLDIAYRILFERRRAAIADRRQRIAERDAVSIPERTRVLQAQCAGKDGTPGQARLETGPLLVGPVHDGKIASRRARIGKAALPNRLDGEQPGENPESSVI